MKSYRRRRKLPAIKRLYPKEGWKMTTAEYVAAFCSKNNLIHGSM
jgi:hypothetical protein